MLGRQHVKHFYQSSIVKQYCGTVSVCKRIIKNDDFNNIVLQLQYTDAFGELDIAISVKDVERLTSMRPDTMQLFSNMNEGNERCSRSVTRPRSGNEVVSYLGPTPYNHSPRFAK